VFQKSGKMSTTTYNQTLTGNYTHSQSHASVIKNFFTWCNGQQHNNLLWAGIAVAGHGCVITPLTIMVVAFAGMNLTLFILAIIGMCMCLVTNLAAMPTRVTIPVFFLSLLIDLGIVFAAVASLL
jgi:hypothetical protein